MGKIAERFEQAFDKASKETPSLAKAIGMALEAVLEDGPHYHYTIPDGYELHQAGAAVHVMPVRAVELRTSGIDVTDGRAGGKIG